MDLKLVANYFEWINERHMIYLRKEVDGDPFPWTDDPILQEYKFTNVFRELDRVTKWIREWHEPHNDSCTLYFNLGMARQFNWPQTLNLIGYIVPWEEYEDCKAIDSDEYMETINWWKPQALTDIVENYQNAGNKVWTGAYMIRGQAGTSKEVWTSKAQYMFHQVLDKVWNAPEPEWTTLEEAWKWWMQFEGFGPFIAYEVVTDMRHTRYLKDAPDIMTWANAGPGAIRGVHRLMGWHHDHKKMKKSWYNDQMETLLALSPKYLEDHVPALEMRDIEHCLCEFDKYERVRLGQGRPRAKYKVK